MSDEGELDPKLVRIVDAICGLQKQALIEYTPIVEGILRSKSSDVRYIEHTLDGLLDFCGDDAVLELFRMLCRHYYFINPAEAAGYVYAYREMYESEEEPGEPICPKEGKS